MNVLIIFAATFAAVILFVAFAICKAGKKECPKQPEKQTL